MLERFTELAGGLDHPEGVAWGPDGRVYAGGEAGQVYSIGLDGTVREVAGTGGFLYGVTLDGDGRVYGCDMGRGEVVRVDPATGSVEEYTAGTQDRPLRVPNFAAFDDAGNLFVTESGDWWEEDGCVFRVAPDGATTLWTEAVHRFPNGCCLTPDGDGLLVVESKARRIVRFPIEDDGTPGAMAVEVELPADAQPDGVTLDAEGAMYVSCYRPDRIYRIPPGGAPSVLAEDPDGLLLNQPANTAFVGDRLDRLAVSSLGGWSISVVEIEVPGLPLRYPKLP